MMTINSLKQGVLFLLVQNIKNMNTPVKTELAKIIEETMGKKTWINLDQYLFSKDGMVTLCWPDYRNHAVLNKDEVKGLIKELKKAIK